ncbi:MAG: glycosyltransferase family 4 protein, partial [bacterium]|nr:glycosyltransferase family 4 protein [bacterium]
MKILLIAYYYPPINSGGTTRPVKMAKFLPRLGHDVTVLTHTYRQTQLTEPGIIRINDISNNKNRKGLKKLFWLVLRGWTEILNRMGIYFSIYSWWKKRVLNLGDEIIEQTKPDIIIASYPPVETLEIGLFFSKKYNIPLVSDFRDGLLFEPIEEKRINRYPCIKRKYEAIERKAAEHSSVLITIMDLITGYFNDTYPGINAKSVGNGFDADDFVGLPGTGTTFDPNKFNILHAGRFSLSDNAISPEAFFQAVRELVEKRPELKDKLQVHLVGELSRRELDAIEDLLRTNVVKYYGMVKRELCLAYQKEADLLLSITQPTRRSTVSSK